MPGNQLSLAPFLASNDVRNEDVDKKLQQLKSSKLTEAKLEQENATVSAKIKVLEDELKSSKLIAAKLEQEIATVSAKIKVLGDELKSSKLIEAKLEQENATVSAKIKVLEDEDGNGPKCFNKHHLQLEHKVRDLELSLKEFKEKCAKLSSANKVLECEGNRMKQEIAGNFILFLFAECWKKRTLLIQSPSERNYLPRLELIKNHRDTSYSKSVCDKFNDIITGQSFTVREDLMDQLEGFAVASLVNPRNNKAHPELNRENFLHGISQLHIATSEPDDCLNIKYLIYLYYRALRGIPV